MGGYGSGRPNGFPCTVEQVRSVSIRSVKQSFDLQWQKHRRFQQVTVAGKWVDLAWTPCHFGGYPKPGEKQNTVFYVAKNRTGPLGRRFLRPVFNRQRFEEDTDSEDGTAEA